DGYISAHSDIVSCNYFCFSCVSAVIIIFNSMLPTMWFYIQIELKNNTKNAYSLIGQALFMMGHIGFAPMTSTLSREFCSFRLVFLNFILSFNTFISGFIYNNRTYEE